MLFISPPFGNYINLPNSVSVKGSFTLEPREGLFMQIIKTLRYSFKNQGWVNAIHDGSYKISRLGVTV